MNPTQSTRDPALSRHLWGLPSFLMWGLIPAFPLLLSRDRDPLNRGPGTIRKGRTAGGLPGSSCAERPLGACPVSPSPLLSPSTFRWRLQCLQADLGADAMHSRVPSGAQTPAWILVILRVLLPEPSLPSLQSSDGKIPALPRDSHTCVRETRQVFAPPDAAEATVKWA